jgi:hypothetical protein
MARLIFLSYIFLLVGMRQKNVRQKNSRKLSTLESKFSGIFCRTFFGLLPRDKR